MYLIFLCYGIWLKSQVILYGNKQTNIQEHNYKINISSLNDIHNEMIQMDILLCPHFTKSKCKSTENECVWVCLFIFL